MAGRWHQAAGIEFGTAALEDDRTVALALAEACRVYAAACPDCQENPHVTSAFWAGVACAVLTFGATPRRTWTRLQLALDRALWLWQQQQRVQAARELRAALEGLDVPGRVM